MSSGPGGVLLILAALYLLLAYFQGRLEWLFRLDDIAAAGNAQAAAEARPSTSGRAA